MQSWRYDGLIHRRRPTREVRVGDVGVGGDNPIRIQSMTTPATRDVAATVEQTARLVEAGCEIVRVTVPTSADAEALPAIRRELGRRGVRVPLVADIHFTPAVAMKAVEHVDKIRINPGNFADKKRFAVREYSDAEYRAELQRIEKVFSPLVLRAQQLGVSMRIGTNHGSLSDRIMNRFGDTPEGMVESALEFVRICEGHGYRDLILSMKASNPVVVLQVYRLLAERMAGEGMDYPFHLGVTEAGEGEDGRVKSAIGIGTLLAEGIGDTIRVSLTEDPVEEIPVARSLVRQLDRLRDRAERDLAGARTGAAPVAEPGDPFRYRRRPADELAAGPLRLGGDRAVRVIVPLRCDPGDTAALREEIDAQAGPRVPEETRAEAVALHLRAREQIEQLEALRRTTELVAPGLALSARIELGWLVEGGEQAIRRWTGAAHLIHVAVVEPPAGPTARALAATVAACRANGSALVAEAGSSRASADSAAEIALETARLAAGSGGPLILAAAPEAGLSPLHTNRRIAARLAQDGLATPLLLLDRPAERGADPLLDGSISLGGLLCDGLGDAVQIDAETAEGSRELAFGILQGARVRITRTEFISCPSCGRTLFDLEETTARIKQRTAHLKGVKIAVMGCVVNGPGEMADADFGYVGWGEDKIALFVGKEMVARDIPTAEADERLVELIKQHGRWSDPSPPPGDGA